MAVTRANAIVGEQLELTITFREDNTGQLFDPYSFEQVDILYADGQTIIETIPNTSITRIGLGQYQVTTQVIAESGMIQDRWLYRIQDGGVIKTSIEITNVSPSPTTSTATESSDALPRHSAVILRPILLTIEFRDDQTGELFDPSEVRQVDILENDGTTLIESITSITRIGVGKYRIQANAISTPQTILDKWYFTTQTGNPEEYHIQDTQVYDQSILGTSDLLCDTTADATSEVLYSDVGPTDAEIVLLNSIEKIGITFKDENDQLINPARVSMELTCINGTQLLADTYLPVSDRDPNPPRIINPSAGRFEFPLGLDNPYTTDGTKKNKTTTRVDYLLTWRASAIAGVKSYVTISGSNPNSSILWTAVNEGTPGDFISVEYVDPGIPDSPLSIIRDGALVTVSLETNAAAAIISTAEDIVNAITADENVSEIITAEIPLGETGLGVVDAVIVTYLADGIDASEELIVCQNIKVITHRICALLQKLRLQIDKAIKLVNNDPENPCFLGYTNGQLATYLENGLHIINAYQPSGTFTLDNYPYSAFEFTLIEASLLAGVMSQELFAVDTDVPNWNDQGNAFVIQHQPQLAQYLNWLSQRLDKIIPMLKLNFVSSGSLHIEAGPNFRLAALIDAAPSGALFRNVFFKA